MDNLSITAKSNPLLKNQLELINKESRTIVNTSRETNNQISISQSVTLKTKPLSNARIEMQKRIDDFHKGQKERMAILKNLSANADIIPNHEGCERVKQIVSQDCEALKTLLDAPFDIVMNNWRKDWERIEQNFSSPTQLAASVAKKAASDIKQWSKAQIKKIFPTSQNVVGHSFESKHEDQIIDEPEAESVKLSF